jgi:hypothetical protein
MTQDELDAIMKDAVIAMKAHVMPFVTPVGRVVETEPGDLPSTTKATAAELWGTGNYIEHNGGIFLVTNEHVVREASQSRLTYQFYKQGGGVTPLILSGPNLPAITFPIDAAVANLDREAWNKANHDGRAVPLERFAKKHEPVPGELLFVLGFAGARATFLYDYLYTPSTSYMTQEASEVDHPSFSAEYHFALPYRPEDTKAAEPNARPLPIPNGLSGSLVWNTRRIECFKDRLEWSPLSARVTGMVWGWPSSSSLLFATRIEYVLEFFEQGFRVLQ